jgi:prephenate dehydrogenase
LRDTVRISGSSPEMWRDIFLANRVQLLAAVDGYLKEINDLRARLAAGDGAAMETAFRRARDARERWLVRPAAIATQKVSS